mgnify:CR=1 FL=1
MGRNRLSISNNIIIIIKEFNGILKLYNNKLFDLLGIKVKNRNDMELNYEFEREFKTIYLYYNIYQNPVSSSLSIKYNKFDKLIDIWGILTYIIIKMNFID